MWYERYAKPAGGEQAGKCHRDKEVACKVVITYAEKQFATAACAAIAFFFSSAHARFKSQPACLPIEYGSVHDYILSSRFPSLILPIAVESADHDSDLCIPHCS